jgi:hypothetical protein
MLRVGESMVTTGHFYGHPSLDIVVQSDAGIATEKSKVTFQLQTVFVKLCATFGVQPKLDYHSIN